MKIVIAMMKHETNTFSPVKTDWNRFKNWGAYFGKKALKVYENTAMPMAAYIHLAREIGADIITPVAAEAMPSGPVSMDAYSRLSDTVCEAVDKGCDMALLDLHGAMVSETTLDGEGALLEKIQNIAPGLPVAVTCDFHCNLTRKMVDNCTALIGYKTYPHVDMYKVAKQVGTIVINSTKKKTKPVISYQQIPLLGHTLKQGTCDEPAKSIIKSCLNAEKNQKILAASFFGGFPLADMPDAGASMLVVADENQKLADKTSEQIADLSWQKRSDFIYHCSPIKESIKKAKASTDFPVVLLDHEDNCGSGGTQDVMAVIKEIINQGLENVAVAAVYDPEAVIEMHKAGVGSKISLSLGGKTDMPSVGLKGEPLVLEGRVRSISDGHWTVHGPMYSGVKVDMGLTAVFETNKIKIVVVSLHHEPWDTGVFTSVGIQPMHEKYLLLKSRIHYRAGFAPILKQTILCDGEGVTTSRNELLNYKHLRRPVFPLDKDVKFFIKGNR